MSDLSQKFDLHLIALRSDEGDERNQCAHISDSACAQNNLFSICRKRKGYVSIKIEHLGGMV